MQPVSRIAAAAMVAFVLAGCSGGRIQHSRSAATSRPSVTATRDGTAKPARAITVAVHGRRIAGQCEGTARPGAATVVLDSGQGSDRAQLSELGNTLVDRTMVCSYDRAGMGASDAATTPRPITELVSDLYAWLTRGGVPGPYFLLGQSQGGADALLFAVEHPGDVAGFVAMNPGTPCALYLRTVPKVMSRDEVAAEAANCRGENDEGVDLRPGNKVLGATLPPSMPYAIMYGWLCQNDFCHRVRPVESADEAKLAKLGRGGRFVDVTGADHEIYATHLAAVLRTVEQVWREATD